MRAASATTCSQLSSTSSSVLCLKYAINVSSSECSGRARTPSVDAIVAPTKAASATGASSISQTPPSNSLLTAAAGLERCPRLADAASPRQRDQSPVAHERHNLREVPFRAQRSARARWGKLSSARAGSGSATARRAGDGGCAAASNARRSPSSSSSARTSSATVSNRGRAARPAFEGADGVHAEPRPARRAPPAKARRPPAGAAKAARNRECRSWAVRQRQPPWFPYRRMAPASPEPPIERQFAARGSGNPSAGWGLDQLDFHPCAHVDAERVDVRPGRRVGQDGVGLERGARVIGVANRTRGSAG
jgi:hypothetical protein